MVIGAIDETGRKTAKRPRESNASTWGKVANGINTVHLSYVRAKTGHALIGARRIPASTLPTR